jgi:16S rRNA (guanine527-N7)-methyltransferase
MNEQIVFFKDKFNVSRETIHKLNIYADFLINSNKYLNLISKTTEKTIFLRHFADSGQIYDLIDNKENIIDIGSGAGFPGVILKLLLDDKKIKSNVELIEKSPKKCKFLTELNKKLNIDIKIVNIRLEDYKFKNMNVVVSRAFKKTSETLGILLKNKNFIKDIILLKGKSYQIELGEALKKYSFNFEKFQSITAEEGKIIKISNIQPVVVNA